MATSPPTRPVFKVVANTEAEENAFDYVADRKHEHPTSLIGAIAHMVKGALGGGILGGHVAYSKSGVYVGLLLNIFFGIYMAYCLHLLVYSATILYKRTRVSTLSYPDVGEAAMACFDNPKVARFSRCFRYWIDTLICLDLFGACACYQLIIAKSIKQLVENTQTTSMEGLTSTHPNLRVYLAAMILPIVLICLIRHLKYLAPFSLAANFVVLLAICTAVYYCAVNNPTLSNLKGVSSFYSTLQFTGMIVFSMSCSGVVIPIENNMKDPKKFPLALIIAKAYEKNLVSQLSKIITAEFETEKVLGYQLLFTDMPIFAKIGMTFIVSGTCCVGFFGYAAFLDQSEAPITVNFPMETFLKILKALIAIMIYVTHALNFWPPFNICFYYIQRRHNQNRIVMWELIYRAIFVFLISILAIVFPNINALMGFLGAFCLTNMAFIWPLTIHLMVIWKRPGLGKYKWRLWRALFMMSVAVFIFFCGSVVNFNELISVFK